VSVTDFELIKLLKEIESLSDLGLQIFIKHASDGTLKIFACKVSQSRTSEKVDQLHEIFKKPSQGIQNNGN
jgi:hypothetical protein